MTLSLDVRAYDADHLSHLEDELLLLHRSVEESRGVTIDLGQRASANVAPSDPHLVSSLTEAARGLRIPTMSLASPASHDAATFTVAGVPTAMLFVGNENGSHNPHDEAAAVMTEWLVSEVTGE
jgi:N-carbamoyl-L-amino-acid hydrolase